MASDFVVPSIPPGMDSRSSAAESGNPSPRVLGYGLTLALVAAATVLAFVVDHIVPASNLSLVFVLPVVIAAASFGWGPALLSAFLSVGVVDFFFVEPRMSFAVASPADLWALGLLLVVAAIVSTVAAQSRGRALDANRAAAQAQALHSLAHAVIQSEPPQALIKAAADSLGRIFNAPAVVLAMRSGKLEPVGASRGASLSAADTEAAEWALSNNKPTRASAYPFDQAEFDFWPVQAPSEGQFLLGVKLADQGDGRPDNPDRQVELVAAYLAAATARVGASKRS
jgi:two-component system sensor histidine kinase KdpD